MTHHPETIVVEYKATTQLLLKQVISNLNDESDYELSGSWMKMKIGWVKMRANRWKKMAFERTTGRSVNM